jgi:hypothetical protein
MDNNTTNQLSIYQPTMMMPGRITEDIMDVSAVEIIPEEIPHPHFIESNTSGITLEELKRTCIVPSFRDNTLTISHQNFAENVLGAAMDYFNGETFGELECRVSHPINGRIPSALHKPANQLTEAERTLFFQRFCFCFELTSMTKTIDGQPICLTIGGVRAYNEQNLYANKSPEKLKIFIGWRVKVCSNLMLSCDGLQDRLEVMSSLDIYKSALDLFTAFDPIDNFNMLENLVNTRLSTQEFCNIIGRMRLYQALPARTRQELHLPELLLGDSQINAATREFVGNENFGLNGQDSISCYQLLQCLNESSKSSYIDTFLTKNRNCVEIATGIQKAIEGRDTENYSWFLS